MLLAVPVLGVAKIVLVHFYETRVLGNLEYLPTIPGGGLAAKAADMERELRALREEAEAEESMVESKIAHRPPGSVPTQEATPPGARTDGSREKRSGHAAVNGGGEAAKAPPNGGGGEGTAESAPDGLAEPDEVKHSPTRNV
jgi:hypothetical protein